jgi:hypothetical protein
MPHPATIYLGSFLLPASTERWLTEICTLPRYKASLFQVNTNYDISLGYKDVDDTTPWRRCPSRLELLNDEGARGSYNKFLCNLFRREGTKIAKRWILATYPYGRAFIQFDIDRHYKEGMTPLEKAEIDADAQREVGNILDMVKDVGCDVVWTSSPGDIIDGEHIQGLYAWIKLDHHLSPKKYKAYVHALKEYYLIECETPSVVRLPGQRYVEVVDPETYEIAHPIDPIKKPQATMAWFLDYWNEAKPLQTQKLASTHAVNALHVQQQMKPQEQAQPVIAQPIKAPAKSVNIAACSKDDALIEQNTFLAATERRICSRIAIKYHGQETYFDQAVEEAKRELVAVRPSTSNTCSNLGLLDSTIRRWMKWYFVHFDPGKSKSSMRDNEDRIRVSSSIAVDTSVLLRYLKKHAGLSYSECSIVRRLDERIKRWNGRISCKVLYSFSGDKRSWFDLFYVGKHSNYNRGKLRSLLVLLDEWQRDGKVRKCRQYGWGEKVISGVEHMAQVQEDAAAVLQDTQEKKRETSSG